MIKCNRSRVFLAIFPSLENSDYSTTNNGGGKCTETHVFAIGYSHRLIRCPVSLRRYTPQYQQGRPVTGMSTHL